MTALPNGFSAGTWNIDPNHSNFAFIARHAGVSKVRGNFAVIAGTVNVGDDFESLTVRATADPATLNTRNEQRDNHLKSKDFFLVDEHPEILFESTGVEDIDGAEFTLNGNLTLRGVTKPVSFKAEFLGSNEDPYGNLVSGFTATTRINRQEFNMEFNAVLPGGDLMVSDKINLEIDVELIKEKAEA